MIRNRRILIGGGLGAVALLVAALFLIQALRSPASTPELDGFRLAENLGCHSCHGPGATGGIANPEHSDNVIPAWDGGTAMMYVENEQEIREWILDGHPKRLEHDHGQGEEHAETSLPIKMPAYRDIVSDSDVDNLVAYYLVVSKLNKLPENVRVGYQLADDLGCFGCHGVGGLTGMPNPRSFKGYIPPWRGGDYDELVHNVEELRSWILDGKIERFESNPLAKFFTKRQIVKMPAYRGTLKKQDLDAVIEYIKWVSSKDGKAFDS